MPNGAPPGVDWGGQREALSLLEQRHFITVLITGNGWGKTTFDINIVANLISPVKNEFFDTPFFNDWKYPKRIRIISDPRHIADDGRIQDCINEWFPREALRKENTRHDKMGYRHLIRYNGWEVQILSTKLEVNAFAGKEVGLIIWDEPFSHSIFNENLARLRAGGHALLTMTPVTEPGAEGTEIGWVFEDLLSGDRDDDIASMYGGFEANCQEHGVAGAISHEHLVRPLKQFENDKIEYEARAFGRHRSIGGLVHPNWTKHRKHIQIEPYDFREWKRMDREPPTLYMMLDPHDSKPFAILWFAMFQDGHGEFVAEWPDNFAYAGATHTYFTLREYVDRIAEIEAQWAPLKVYQRYIDKNYGNQMVARENCKTSIKQELTRISGGRLWFLDNPGGHRPWKEAKHVLHGLLEPTDLGDDVMKPPRWRCFSTLTNLDHAMRHYLMMARSGRAADRHGEISDKPAEKHKCFPNMVEWLALGRPEWVEPPDRRDDEEPVAASDYARVSGDWS